MNILLDLKDMCEFFGYPVETTREKDISIYDKGVKGIRNQKISDMDNRLDLFSPQKPFVLCFDNTANVHVIRVHI